MAAEGPGDRARIALLLCLSAWLLAFGYAFVAFSTTDATGEGFIRGFNKIGVFVGWHALAAALALAAFFVSRAWPPGASLRRLGAVPVVLAAIEIAALVAVIVWARWG